MNGKLKVDKPDTIEHGEIEGRKKLERSSALWLGGGKRKMELGGSRGPRTLEDYELVSWFFSRDGH